MAAERAAPCVAALRTAGIDEVTAQRSGVLSTDATASNHGGQPSHSEVAIADFGGNTSSLSIGLQHDACIVLPGKVKDSRESQPRDKFIGKHGTVPDETHPSSPNDSTSTSAAHPSSSASISAFPSSKPLATSCVAQGEAHRCNTQQRSVEKEAAMIIDNDMPTEPITSASPRSTTPSASSYQSNNVISSSDAAFSSSVFFAQSSPFSSHPLLATLSPTPHAGNSSHSNASRHDSQQRAAGKAAAEDPAGPIQPALWTRTPPSFSQLNDLVNSSTISTSRLRCHIQLCPCSS